MESQGFSIRFLFFMLILEFLTGLNSEVLKSSYSLISRRVGSWTKATRVE